MFHCVANTIGEAPDGKQTSSGTSFIREPNGIPLAEAGAYQEEIITSVLDLSRADRSYILDSMADPKFGTGVVKVTPAHDPNDFEAGRRHKLPLIKVIGEDAKARWVKVRHS